jgi:FtsZ-binding cell division protein ZapB
LRSEKNNINKNYEKLKLNCEQYKTEIFTINKLIGELKSKNNKLSKENNKLVKSNDELQQENNSNKI